MTRLLARLRAAWRWYVAAVRHVEHEFDENGECACGRIAGEW